MEFPHFNLTGAGFILLTLVCLAVLLTGWNKAAKSSMLPSKKRKYAFAFRLAGIILWICILTILSLSGILSDFSTMPPKMMIVLVVPFIYVILTSFSKTGKEVALSIPPENLMFLQAFRIPVEFLLWKMVLDGVLPERMSFEGLNFDIISGISGLIMGFLYMKYGTRLKKLAIVWNIAGLLLLINIVTIALLSMPTPFQYFKGEPSNEIVATFPYMLLPGVLVPIAYGLHLLSLRQLFLIKNKK